MPFKSSYQANFILKLRYFHQILSLLTYDKNNFIFIQNKTYN